MGEAPGSATGKPELEPPTSGGRCPTTYTSSYLAFGGPPRTSGRNVNSNTKRVLVGVFLFESATRWLFAKLEILYFTAWRRRLQNETTFKKRTCKMSALFTTSLFGSVREPYKSSLSHGRRGPGRNTGPPRVPRSIYHCYRLRGAPPPPPLYLS